MKKKKLFVVWVTLVSSLILGQALNNRGAQDSQIEQTIMGLRQRLDEAILRGDIQTVAQVVSEDYISTDPQGNTGAKQDLISFVEHVASLPSAVRPSASVVVEDISVRVYGDTVVAVGIIKTKSEYSTYQALVDKRPPDSVVNRRRFTEVYAKFRDEWQLVASHMTNLPNVAPHPSPKLK